MIFDELFLVLGAHALQWVELSFEVSFESVASLDDLVHDFKSLLLADSWAKRVVSEISANSDSCGVDHGGFFLVEISVFELLGVHVRLMLILWTVAVVFLSDSVEKFVEFGVCMVGSSIETDSRVKVGNSGEDTRLESYTCIV